MTISIDGSDNSRVATSLTIQCTLTTTKSNDIIFFAVCEQTGNLFGTLSIADTAGLTWYTRYELSSAIQSMRIYWALAPSPVTTTITLTDTKALNKAAVAFGLNGLDLTNVFDANNSLPSWNVQTSTTSVHVTYSTSTTGDTMVLGFSAHGGTGTDSYDPTMTIIDQSTTGGGPRITAAYMFVNGPLTDNTETVTITSSNSLAFLIDAVIPPAVSKGRRLMLMGVGQ